MELTQDIVDGYVGGQLEVQNMSENYLYRGEIKSVTMDSEDGSQRIVITFAWLAKMSETGWEVNDPKPYKASMALYKASDVGQGRIFLSSPFLRESTTLFPPGGSKLEASEVQGLVLD